MNAECHYQNTDLNEDHVGGSWRWVVLRLVAAFVLLVAAMLKFHALATAPSLFLDGGLLHARWFNILVVEFELFFGTWLIFGILPKLSWLATVGCYSGFALISLSKAAFAEVSCGCFGNLAVPPWITALLDLVLVAFLMVFRPKGIMFYWNVFFREISSLKHYKRRMIVAMMVWLLLAVPITIIMTSVKFTVLTEGSVLSEKDKSVTLEPKNWLGKKFPLFEFIVFDNGFNRDNLKIGGWSILLYHVDCKKCQELLAKINDQSKNETFENLILIEIPGKEVKQGFFNGVQSHVVSGTLQSGTEWFVQTPVLLKLSHGMVLDISTNDNIQFPAK